MSLLCGIQRCYNAWVYRAAVARVWEEGIRTMSRGEAWVDAGGDGEGEGLGVLGGVDGSIVIVRVVDDMSLIMIIFTPMAMLQTPLAPIMFDEFPAEVPANTLAQVSQGTSTPLKQFKGSSTLDRLAGTISC